MFEIPIWLGVVYLIFFFGPTVLAVVSIILVFFRKSFMAGFVCGVVGLISAFPLHMFFCLIGAYTDGGMKLTDLTWHNLFIVGSPSVCALMIVIAAAQVDKAAKKKRNEAAA